MRVRSMIGADTPAVLAMMRALWPDCDDEAVTDDATYVLEREGGALGGFVTLTLRPFVEDLRGQGGGRALMTAAEAWARGLGARELGSDARVDNPGSLAAHGQLGFVEVERAATFRKVLGDGGGRFVRRARPDLPALIAAANLLADALGVAGAGDAELTGLYDAILLAPAGDDAWRQYLAGRLGERELREQVLEGVATWLGDRAGREAAADATLPAALIDLFDRALLGRPAADDDVSRGR
jgi:aminoglycoside 6'-N-acetyltransferase I